MKSVRVAGLVLLAVTACGTGRVERLDLAADGFAGDASVGADGGVWLGWTQPPDVFGADIEIYPGSRGPVVQIDRTSEFPAVSDIRRGRVEWQSRAEVDLDLIAETATETVLWQVLEGDEGVIVRMSYEAGTTGSDGERREGGPVGFFSHPERLDSIEGTVAVASPTSVVASEAGLALLDETTGQAALVRATTGGLVSTVAPLDAGRLCDVGAVEARFAVTASSDAGATGCDELWFEDGGSFSRVLGGTGTAVAGIGFADGFALVVSREDPVPCGETTCEMGARLHDADGRAIRDLAPVPLTARANIAVGEIRGVPVVFGGVDRRPVAIETTERFVEFDRETFEVVEPGIASRERADGVAFADGAWSPMKPFPASHRKITEPLRVVFTPHGLAVQNLNLLGVWRPEGEFSIDFASMFGWQLWVATESACLNLRGRPGLTGNVIDCVERGESFWSDGSHAVVDDIRWVSVLIPGRDVRGWVAEQYLSGVSPDDPSQYGCG